MPITLKMMTAKQFEMQVRFAAAKALNDGAFAAREALSTSLTETFHLRNKYSHTGLRVVKAKRGQLLAEAGQLRAYLLEHVEGGRRTHAAIPFQRLRRKRRIPRSQWPQKQIATRRSFIARSKRGRGRVVVRRVGKRRLRYQWAIPDTAQRIRPRWRYGAVALKAARPTVTTALRTARVR